MCDDFIPYGKQYIDEEDINEVIKVLKSDYLTTGPKIQQFEKELCKVTNAKYATAISNGTTSLHAACYAAGIKKGDEVITTPITFAATSNAILYCGGTPVFADIDKTTYNIDPQSIEEKITNKTKAIIAVDYTGNPCDYDKIINIAKKYNLIVIEDAAHAIGSEYKGIKVGSIADITTFSFHPVKTITTAEGGAVTTNNKEYDTKLKLFRSHGITRDRNLMIKDEGLWYYEQLELGNNYRLNDLQCALGISQLKKLTEFKTKRRCIVEKYKEYLKEVKEIILPHETEGAKSCYHIFVIKLNNETITKSRKEVFDELRNKNIGVNVHYIPVYYHPYYKQLGYNKGICPVAEEFYELIITLPLHPQMTDNNIKYICDSLKKVVS
jgi:UDP-4-amino-4,6-dideoxy-N-acetyl-beta-L-altrosamine transaminase